MNQDVKAQWVAALRSGAYQQEYTTMRRTEGYCVIGVMCDLHSKATGTPWVYDPNCTFPYSYMGSASNPSCQVLEWAGLDERWRWLEQMNDREIPFAALADYIEQFL